MPGCLQNGSVQSNHVRLIINNQYPGHSCSLQLRPDTARLSRLGNTIDCQYVSSSPHVHLVFSSCVVNVRKCLSQDRKSTRLNSSHMSISYAVFCLKKK